MSTHPGHNLVGLECGAGRWPNIGNHHECWGKPWRGVVLAVNDPRAWENTLAFAGLPTQEEVDAHLAKLEQRFADDPRLKGQHPLTGKVPVLWDFGDSGARILWETVRLIRPYAEDLAAWSALKLEAEQREATRH